MAEFSTFKGSWPLDLGSGHTAYRHAPLIDLYIHTKFHWNRMNFVWTYGRADGHLRPTRSSRPKSSWYGTILSNEWSKNFYKKPHCISWRYWRLMTACHQWHWNDSQWFQWATHTQKLPHSRGDLNAHLIHGSWAHMSQPSNGITIGLAIFA